EGTEGEPAAYGSEYGPYDPPPVEEGYTRFEAMTLKDVEPGADVTRCQYAMAPVEADTDVLDVVGLQSAFGHHLVAFTHVPRPDDVLGGEVACMQGSNEFSAGAGASGGGYLGATSPAKPRVAPLPQGVAYRLKKGEGMVLNIHFINTGAEPIDGDSYIDLKLAEADPDRVIASMFVNFNGAIDVAPGTQADSSVDCVAESDVEFVMMSNHMHEWGTQATTEVERAATGAVEVMRHDAVWTHDLANAPVWAQWTAEEPFVLRAGDTLRTSCTWSNTTTEVLSFPREMCVSAGFALSRGASAKVPSCFNGTWVPDGL
ncbi:MAG: hypothetical protein FJ104_05475, partial [Deltaproteobacteria bacterium]|nr:hypothetical protein [Deltaproteobacteria bacterium]